MNEIASFTPHLIEFAQGAIDALWSMPLAVLIAFALAPTFIGLWSGSLLNFLAVAFVNAATIIAWWHGGALRADALIGAMTFLAALALALILRRERKRSDQLAAIVSEVSTLNARIGDYLEALHLRSEAIDERAVEVAKRLEAVERSWLRKSAMAQPVMEPAE